ncbi:MAG: hypothetical protein ACYDDB_01275 [bacterium]
MSAYICSTEHLKAIALYAAHGREIRVNPVFITQFMQDENVRENLENYGNNLRNRHEIAQYYANILYQENIKSVLSRYPNDTLEAAPGNIDKPPYITVTAEAYADAKDYTPLEILSLCQGYKYQACETDGWRQSSAYELIYQIEQAAIRRLPGYDDTPWSI